MSKEVILTGLRSNAEFHLGNYLGAILPMVNLQKKYAGQYQINMFIPDLHSLISPIEHGSLYAQTINNLKVFVAAGLDINDQNTFIYRQSYIPAHSELAWILDCFTGFGEMKRMTQFKDKSRQIAGENTDFAIKGGSFRGGEISIDGEFAVDVLGAIEDEKMQKGEDIILSGGLDNLPISVGLFNYPVLMAADILLYGARWVPVGEDQRQHIELARDLAFRLNSKFGNGILVAPNEWKKQVEFAELDTGVRIRSLRNPNKKMSKSVPDPSGTILMSDNASIAAKKIMAATTDSFGEVRYDYKQRPGVSNLLDILKLFGGNPDDFIGKKEYGSLKEAVASKVATFLGNFQVMLAENVNETELMNKLEADEAAMNIVANETLLKVQRAVGLRPASK